MVPVPALLLRLAALVRGFVKWDHQPASLEEFGRSAVRAYGVATTAPMAPVLLVVDAKLQKAPVEGALPVPPISRPHFPSADPGSVREIARMLVDAENPRITAGLAARTQEGIDRLVELAELLQAPVDGGSARLNFPTRHPLAGAGTGQPDVVAAAHAERRRRDIRNARYGWDASPVSLARIAAELWPLIKDEDWSFSSPQGFIGGWPSRLWDMKRSYHSIGSHGGGGMGYALPASVGAALANREHGRITININGDGDLNYAPGALWTAVHHRIPLLTIVHNNRAYHQEVMYLQQQCAARNRGVDRAAVGTTITDPNIDYAQMARAYGMHAQGPIEHPADLGPALRRGVERVKAGEPALIDVVSQPR